MSKYCTNCGREISDSETLCDNCKSGTTTVITSTTVNPSSTSENNGYAIAGFVCSLAGLSIVGMILSIIGLNKCKKENANNKGLAIAGIVIAAVKLVLVFFFIVFYIIIAIYATNDIKDNYYPSTSYDTYGSTYDYGR